MRKSLMHRNNWIMVITGIIVTYIGFVMVSPITYNYDGFYAFLSIFVIVSGLLTVIIGLSIDFINKEE